MGRGMAAIGGRSHALAFRALGIEAVQAETPDEARRALARLAGEQCAVIYIAEDLAEQIGEAIARYRSQPLPAIIPIPGAAGGAGLGMRGVRGDARRAAGADILFTTEEG